MRLNSFGGRFATNYLAIMDLSMIVLLLAVPSAVTGALLGLWHWAAVPATILVSILTAGAVLVAATIAARAWRRITRT